MFTRRPASVSAAEGAREAGAEVTVKRVPELVPEQVARDAHYKLDQPAQVAEPGELRLGGLLVGHVSFFWG